MSSVFDALQCHLKEMEEAGKESVAASAYARAAQRAITDLAELANACNVALVDLEGAAADRLRSALDTCVGGAA